MPRKIRVEYPGAIYHVMNRGDRREDIFVDDQDREAFLKTLGDTCTKTNWQVHAYCLMPNHFHLVVETPQANLVAGMKWFLGTYTMRFNRRHKMSGHLFAGRYKSLIVDGSGNGYLKTVCDYVHLNPARAKMLGEGGLSNYPWSSYLEYLKEPTQRVSWLRVDRLLGEMRIPQDSAPGRREFQQQLAMRLAEKNPEAWEKVRRGWCLGEDAFKKELLAQIGGRLRDNHYGEERRESEEEKAERILVEELAAAGWQRSDLSKRAKNAPEKIRIARRLRSETTMTLKWIAAQMEMGAWTYLSSLLNKPQAEVTPPPSVKRASVTSEEASPLVLWD